MALLEISFRVLQLLNLFFGLHLKHVLHPHLLHLSYTLLSFFFLLRLRALRKLPSAFVVNSIVSHSCQFSASVVLIGHVTWNIKSCMCVLINMSPRTVNPNVRYV